MGFVKDIKVEKYHDGSWRVLAYYARRQAELKWSNRRLEKKYKYGFASMEDAIAAKDEFKRELEQLAHGGPTSSKKSMPKRKSFGWRKQDNAVGQASKKQRQYTESRSGIRASRQQEKFTNVSQCAAGVARELYNKMENNTAYELLVDDDGKGADLNDVSRKQLQRVNLQVQALYRYYMILSDTAKNEKDVRDAELCDAAGSLCLPQVMLCTHYTFIPIIQLRILSAIHIASRADAYIGLSKRRVARCDVQPCC